MTRRCSHCSNDGHNSRTCPSRGGPAAAAAGGSVRLFGVRLTDGSIMKKSASMGNLGSFMKKSASMGNLSSSAAASPNPGGSPSWDVLREPAHSTDGYLSDDPAHASSSTNRRAERKKGVPWSEEEHRLFLLGLQKLGKGDWRGISRNFVTTRTPTQVASHAQKYFIRHSNATRRKRRSSLFDMVPDAAIDPQPMPEEQFMLPPQALETETAELVPPASKAVETDSADSLPSLDLSLKPDVDSMDATPTELVQENFTVTTEIPLVYPQFIPAYIPIPFPIWPSNAVALDEDRGGAETSRHQILKPIPVVPKEPVNVDELVGMSRLSLGETRSGQKDPLPLSLKLTGESSRQSAFHARTPDNSSGISKGETTPIQAL
ncbi:PREDICTED: transcription factor MYB1R1-like isoform X2 [Ipomoea nil]|uniref:transcription factor MYB1R1-like isoform X2 n=1 Tax=Ipomoea nil TaxID=35883 RepID=UPI000901BCEF|nr:PREDICTED: transcription factor MYB1R1-like isoform X2 [Ipomoea nil]